MRNNDVFMHTEEFGDLYLAKSLLFYVYPRCFVCKNKNNKMYLFYEMSSEKDRDIWLVSMITDIEYSELVERKKAVQEVYRCHDESDLYSVAKIYGKNGSIEIRNDCNTLITKLPSVNVYADI